MPYQPIENHGLLGNLRTAALVETDGSIARPRWTPRVF
jgi:hypothetical protein